MLLLCNADVHAPEALGLHHVLIGGGKILWMGTSLPTLPAEFAIDTLDLEGLRLIPGLVDGHVHVSGGGGEAGFVSRVPAPLLTRYTAAGVTWGPNVNVTYATYKDAFAGAITNKTPFSAAVDAMQSATVSDLKKNGFAVAGS